jgi:uncharacterized protein YoxC
MSEFGLELPPTTKLGDDGKGEKAFIIGQSKVAAVLGVVAVLAIFAGGLYMVNCTQQAEFTSAIEQEHKFEEHQRASKVEAETKMAEMSAEMHKLSEKSKDQESDLKIMASHLQYVQQVSLINIMQSIDDESLTVADIKKTVKEQFEGMEKETEQILHDHLIVVEGANAKSNAEMDRIEAEVHEMTKAQQKYDTEMAAQQEAAGAPPADAQPSEQETKAIEERISAIFTHVYDLAEKMGDADIDGLLDAKKVAEWEQVLTDAETGKLAYPKAVEKMEHIITEQPAALKLAEVTNALQLIEEDGGAKGVTEVTNFRNLLKEVKWLPQYAAVLEEFSQWREGHKTVQEVLAWTEEKLAAGEIDGTWLAKAYETTAKAAAPAAPAAKPATATATAAAAAATAKSAPAAAATTGKTLPGGL